MLQPSGKLWVMLKAATAGAVTLSSSPQGIGGLGSEPGVWLLVMHEVTWEGGVLFALELEGGHQ